MLSPIRPASDVDLDVDVDDDPSVVVRQSESELRLLKSGEFSDFTIVCGDREWKVHKAILSKVPYFNAIVGGGFKETVEENITIMEFFEPFEIQWLLAYIYFPYFDPESARFDTASKSYSETCVRLWQLGDYFQVKGMTERAEQKLGASCKRWRQLSANVDTVIRGTTFKVDVEYAIRRAWREDLASGPLRETLTELCLDFAPYLRNEQSFLTLLDEFPRFAIAFSQRAMGSITSSLRLPKPTPSTSADDEAQKMRKTNSVSRRTRQSTGGAVNTARRGVHERQQFRRLLGRQGSAPL